MSGGGRLSLGLDGDDFHTTFGVGEAGQPIHPVDGVGVALAAIQGLHAVIEDQTRELERLREQIAAAEQARRPSQGDPPERSE